MATEDHTASDRFELPEFVVTFATNPKIAVALSVLVPIIIVSALGETITPYDPLETDPINRYGSPSAEHPFGTDDIGRDLLSRVIVGGRTSLALGFGATALSLAIGVPIGLISGYAKGRLDELLMRLMDIIMSIPVLLLGILLLVALPGGMTTLILAVGVVFAPRIARVTRSATLSISEEPYVLAAQARGESDLHILFREILPNATAPIVVEGSIRVGYAILIGTSLSFLGLGTGPPHPDWGFMIATARLHIYDTPWYLLWPSIALSLTIVSTNLLGDGLRDVLDPRTVEDQR